MIPWILVSALLAADPAPSAMVLEVQGEIVAQRAGKELLLDDGDLLHLGDQITLPAGAALKAYFRPSGPVVSLKGPAQALVTAGKLETAAQVAVRDPKLPTRVADGLVAQSGNSSLVGGLTLRGVPHPQVHPVVGMVVLQPTPTFRWPAAAGKARYRLELLTGAEGNPVWREETASNTLTYPKQRKPLTRGMGYRWRVFTLNADGSMKPHVEEVPFKVLNTDLAETLPEIQKLVASSDPTDWRLAAEVYRSWAVHDEAVALYEKLAEKQPKSAHLWKLLASYYTQAGDRDQAQTARQKVQALQK
ncbi:MAG: tetratricopeptide repeat protein [Bacteroidales bacterium]|nr:tetratricopeptide repeat protein [Bacteroidales bacterium]